MPDHATPLPDLTLRVRAKLNILGVGLALRTGEVADLPAAKATELLNKGFVEPVADELEYR